MIMLPIYEDTPRQVARLIPALSPFSFLYSWTLGFLNELLLDVALKETHDFFGF
jgi:hypothetical protein